MTPAELLTLEQGLSVARLAPYRAQVGGDLGRAVHLYEWNRDVAAAFGATLGDLEILVRNAMHDALTAYWIDRRCRVRQLLAQRPFNNRGFRWSTRPGR